MQGASSRLQAVEVLLLGFKCSYQVCDAGGVISLRFFVSSCSECTLHQ